MAKFIQTIIDKVIQVSTSLYCGRADGDFNQTLHSWCSISYRKRLMVTFDICVRLSRTKKDTLWSYMNSTAGEWMSKWVNGAPIYILILSCYTILALLPSAHAQGVSNWSCRCRCRRHQQKIARSWDLGTSVTRTYNESIDVGKKLASGCLESGGMAYKRHKHNNVF